MAGTATSIGAAPGSSSDALLQAVQKQHEEDLRSLKEQYERRIEGFALDVLDRCGRREHLI